MRSFWEGKTYLKIVASLLIFVCFCKRFRSFNTKNMGSENQRASKSLAVKVGSWISGFGWRTCSKKFQNAIFSRYQKILSWGNLSGSMNMILSMNYNRHLKHILKHILANIDYNRVCNITWKNRPDELEAYFRLQRFLLNLTLEERILCFINVKLNIYFWFKLYKLHLSLSTFHDLW